MSSLNDAVHTLRAALLTERPELVRVFDASITALPPEAFTPEACRELATIVGALVAEVLTLRLALDAVDECAKRAKQNARGMVVLCEATRDLRQLARGGRLPEGYAADELVRLAQHQVHERLAQERLDQERGEDAGG